MQKSMTVRNGRGSHRHNVRDYKQMPEHIDPVLSGENEILVDIPLWKAYNDIFQNAIDEYNGRQKRADRKLPNAQEYLKEIKAETGDMARKPYYETFIQIGDRNDTGITDCETEKIVLKKFIKEWDKRNPYMKMIGAYIHADEFNGTLHAHIDWIPIGTNYQRGMRIQNGLKRALKQQGFEGKSRKFNAYLGWQESERAALTAIAKEYGIERKETKEEHRDWMDKETYIQREQLKDVLTALEQLEPAVELAEAAKNANGVKTLTGYVKMSQESYKSLVAAAETGAIALQANISVNDDLIRIKRQVEQLQHENERLLQNKRKFIELEIIAKKYEKLQKDLQRLGIDLDSLNIEKQKNKNRSR